MTDSHPRHLLVVATQCESESHLDRLGSAADILLDSLTTPEIGDAKGSVLGGPAEKPDIESTVRRAVEEAGAEGAVLILAFLGHGFADETGGSLYFMAHDTRRDEPASGVDVARLLAEAAKQPGIAGVIGLIDTCHAGGGVPDLRLLDGRTGLAVLMGAAREQLAYRMDFTFTLVDLLRGGMPDVGDLLYVDARLHENLCGALPSQTPVLVNLSGEMAKGIWLAHNASCWPDTAVGGVGPVGREELVAAVWAWDSAYPLPGSWTRRAIHELRDSVAARAPGPSGQRVLWVVNAVIHAMKAAEFIRDHMTSTLTTPTMLSAARRAGLNPSAVRSSGSTLLVALLETAALRTAKVGRSEWEPLTRFMATLATRSGLPRDHVELRQWARGCGLETELNDAFEALDATADRTDLRLILSLPDGVTGWPAAIDAWLVRAGEAPISRMVGCARNDQPSTEDAVRRAVLWAHAELQPGEILHRVDIAVPAERLADWCPEDIQAGLHRLVVRHDVLLQWSGRLRPDELLPEMNTVGRAAIRTITEDTDVPIDWINREDLHDAAALNLRLMNGEFQRAIGVRHRPGELADVLDLLLRYSPVLLWPGSASLDETWPDVVRQNWDALPYEFAVAHRERLKGNDVPLAHARAVWHDAEWLEFARQFERRIVCSPLLTEQGSEPR